MCLYIHADARQKPVAGAPASSMTAMWIAGCSFTELSSAQFHTALQFVCPVCPLSSAQDLPGRANVHLLSKAGGRQLWHRIRHQLWQQCLLQAVDNPVNIPGALVLEEE